MDDYMKWMSKWLKKCLQKREGSLERKSDSTRLKSKHTPTPASQPSPLVIRIRHGSGGPWGRCRQHGVAPSLAWFAVGAALAFHFGCLGRWRRGAVFAPSLAFATSRSRLIFADLVRCHRLLFIRFRLFGFLLHYHVPRRVTNRACRFYCQSLWTFPVQNMYFWRSLVSQKFNLQENGSFILGGEDQRFC